MKFTTDNYKDAAMQACEALLQYLGEHEYNKKYVEAVASLAMMAAERIEDSISVEFDAEALQKTKTAEEAALATLNLRRSLDLL